MKSLALAVLAMLAGAAALADPPKTDVRFVIEAQQFVDGLGRSRSSVERALTVMLLEECRAQKSFPFIRWVSNDAEATNHLVVALVQRKAGGDFETLIEYRGTTKSGSQPPALQEVVYRWFEAKNADTVEVVKPRLEDKIHAQFKSEAFRKDLLGYFVSRIPLAESVDLDSTSHRVLVPVPATNLQADEQHSELAVSFFGKGDGRPGTMTLREPLDFPLRGGVLCQIKEFNFAGVPPLTGDWNDRIPQVFSPAKVRDIRVTMANYVPKWFAGSRGGSVPND